MLNSGVSKLFAVTGSRADLGLIVNSCKPLKDYFKVSVLHLGDHEILPALSGFPISRIAWPSDKRPITASEISLAYQHLMSVAQKTFETESPNLIYLSGDRWEIHAIATVAFLLRIPVAHLAGGDQTEGSYDDAYRNGISSFGAVHFVTNELAEKQLIKRGIPPNRVFKTGSPSLDDVPSSLQTNSNELLSRYNLEQKKYYVVSYQPETLGFEDANVKKFFTAMTELSSTSRLVWVLPNADLGSAEIEKKIVQLASKQSAIVVRPFFERSEYLRLVSLSSGLIGNSSSGVYEAPLLGVPVLNIGLRQRGRLLARNIISVDYDDIKIGLAKMKNLDLVNLNSHYGDGKSGERIAKLLSEAIREKRL